jgi:hypothetical protein
MARMAAALAGLAFALAAAEIAARALRASD